MLERWERLLEQHIRTNSQLMTREPAGQLTHPYTVPSAPGAAHYSTALWDWDSWSASIVLGQVAADTDRPDQFTAYEQGSVLNFLDHADDDGVVPIQLTPDGTLTHSDPSRAGGFSENMHKPVLAQHAAMLTRRAGSADWIRPSLPTIGRFIDRYLESHVHAGTGLAYWQTDFAIGVDNDPSAFYRPARSTASVYLNSLLYRELQAYGALLEEVGDLPQAGRRRNQAADLADAMRSYLWDERDGTFYSADLALRPVDDEDWLHRGAPRRWQSLLLRIDNWSSFLPMWAGVATAEQAERMRQRATRWRNPGSQGRSHFRRHRRSCQCSQRQQRTCPCNDHWWTHHTQRCEQRARGNLLDQRHRYDESRNWAVCSCQLWPRKHLLRWRFRIWRRL